MSNESDGSGRPDDIVIIKQLLQKLEEAAARDAESPREAPSAAELAADSVREEPPLLVLRSSRSSISTQSDSASDGEPSKSHAMPDFARVPISIDLPSSDRALVTVPAEAAPQRWRPGFAMAGLSFALGIVAAGGLIVAFDPFAQRGGGATVTRPPAPKVPTAVAVAGESARAASISTPAESAPVSAPSPTVVSQPDIVMPETARQESAAIVSGGAATGGNPQGDGRSEEAAAVRNRDVVSPNIAAVPSPSNGAIEKVELRIASRVELRAGERRSIDVRVDAAASEVPRLLVVFRQVPGWMTFSKGGAIGNDIWLLPAPQVRDLEIEVSEGASGVADVKVQLARVDGSILSETTVAFAAAAQMSAPLTAALQSQAGNEATILRLQARGELLLDTGEVEAARTLLRTAAEAGSVAAALRLAETYDPAEIQRLGMGERTADVGQAVRWYEHAQALGSPVAAARLVALGRR